MRRIASSTGFVVTLALAGCGGGGTTIYGSAAQVPSGVSATTGYGVAVFAKLPGTLRPDDLLMHGGNLYVVAQDNNNNPDGTNVPGTTPQSEVLEYGLNGQLLKTFDVPGHPDGIMEFDANTIWVSTNEDADPLLIVIHTDTGTQATLSADATPAHGGGLDDLKMLGGVVYAAASNPTLQAGTASQPNGVSVVPALYSVTLNADNQTFHLTPALMGDATATSLAQGGSVTLDLTDPDSMAVDTAGDLVLDSQQDSELVFIHNPGASQTVSVLPLALYGNAWPVDDTRWGIGGNAVMLLSDNHAQLIYRIEATSGFAQGTAYSAGQGTVLSLDTTTGNLTPIITGMNTPHGLIFVPN